MKKEESAIIWTREEKKIFEWSPSKSLIKSIRRYQKYHAMNSLLYLPLKAYNKMLYRLWSILTSTDIYPTAKIGYGLALPHPNGIVIHRNAVLGCNCMIMQQVTIGQTESDFDVPIIGNGVYIGAGAKIIGKVQIGDNAKIGANAVVIDDVPDGFTAVGIPARIFFGSTNKRN